MCSRQRLGTERTRRSASVDDALRVPGRKVRRPCRSREASFDVTVERGTARSSPAGVPARQGGESTMRVMVIVKANEDTEAGVPPDRKLLTEMGAFNEELV